MNPLVRLLCLAIRLLCLAGGLLEPVAAPAQTPARQALPPESEQAVRELHDVLARGWLGPTHPWYDELSQDVRPYVLPPEETESGPSFWGRLVNWIAEAWEGMADWLGQIRWEGELFGYRFAISLYHVLLLVLALLVAWLVVRLLRRWYSAYLAQQQPQQQVERSGQGAPERIDQLPVAVPTGSAGLWELVQQAVEQKQFSRAIVFLYSYLLLRLDQQGRIRLEKGRTNRQYLRQLRSDPQLQRWMARIVAAFEEVFFGHRELEAEAFQQCWELVPQIQSRVEQKGGSGA